MPEWLHVVISGVLAGGTLSFHKVLCCFPHRQWPSLVLFVLFWFCFVFRWPVLMTAHKLLSRSIPYSFNFLGSEFFLFVRAALVIIKPNC